MSVARRQMQVWVEIPPSPLHTASRASSSSAANNNSKGTPKVTTNAPFTPRRIDHNILLNKLQRPAYTPSKMNIDRREMAPTLSSAHKRKLAETEDTGNAQKTKKPKVSAENADAFPNGSFYCHQCCRKLDLSHVMACTRIVKGKRCRSKYCDKCLKNRYEKDSQAIKSAGLRYDEKGFEQHFLEQGYIFSCPKCLGDCNCRLCRKAKGLPALGRLAPRPPKKEKVLKTDQRENVKPSVAKPGKSASFRVEIVRSPGWQSPSKPLGNLAMTIVDKTIAPKVDKFRIVRPPKPVAQPAWQLLPTDLTLDEVEERIQLREFMVRFGALMNNVSTKTLEGLEDLENIPEPACKAVLLTLLDLIAVDSTGSAKKNITQAIEDIRGSGLNFDNMWATLAALRDTDVVTLSFPDPAPVRVRPQVNQRSTRSGGGRQLVGEQLLPIMLALIDETTEGPSVREELETGEQDRKRENEAMYAKRREENARWEVERAALLEEKEKGEKKEGWKANVWKAKYKERYEAHKAAVTNLEQELVKDVYLRAPRFRALGTDGDGRVYYALSPSVAKRLPSDNVREALRKWPWHVSVWGKAPEGAEIKRSQDDAEDGDEDKDDDDEESKKKWWGFANPQEITKLAKWLDANNGTQGRQSGSFNGKASIPSDHVDGNTNAANTPPNPTVKSLVKGLNDYADTLRWRLSKRDPPKNAPVPAASFYA